MNILGLCSWFHDSSAALLVDGDVVGYVEEERFNRQKHTTAYPAQSVAWLLETAGLQMDDIDEVAFYINPSQYLATGVKALGSSLPGSLNLLRPDAATEPPLRRLAWMAGLRRRLTRIHGGNGRFKLSFLDHYKTHQGAAYYPSPFDDAAVLTMDFAVDGTTEVVAHARGNQITDVLKHRLPHGFGIVYATITHVLGFKWYDEYKVMGMAAYGTPRYIDRLRSLYHLDPDTGELRLDLRYFNFQHYGMNRMVNARLKELFWEPRTPLDPIDERDYDLAASLQALTNEYGVAMARIARRITGASAICMAGGVVQNVLMNQAIAESGVFEELFFQPLAGDFGCSLGGAAYLNHAVHDSEKRYRMSHLYLGPSYRDQSHSEADRRGMVARDVPDWHGAVAQAIADGLVVGYYDGRMEAGPRALGSRSILADPRRADMKDILNARVKHREHFRPFAPSILAEELETVFEPLPGCRSLEYMIVTMTVREQWRARVPAISHADGTARPQAVRAETAPNYHRIISEFARLTGVPLVVNTSFNDNEPIVCTPYDAIECFRRTNIDLLVLDGRLYFRSDNAHAVNTQMEAL